MVLKPKASNLGKQNLCLAKSPANMSPVLWAWAPHFPEYQLSLLPIVLHYLSPSFTWPFPYCVTSGYGWRLSEPRDRRAAHTEWILDSIRVLED